MTRYLLLALICVCPLLAYVFDTGPVPVFLAGMVGIAVLADWVRRASEQLALHAGPTIGGLITVSLGSLSELLLALFVLLEGEASVVKAQITGSILATSLLGLGVAVIVGGWQRERQCFNRERAGLQASLFILVVVALLLPAVFDFTGRQVTGNPTIAIDDEALSLVVSTVLLLVYAGNLVYTLVTHRDVFARGDGDDETPRWSVTTALLVLAGAVAAVAFESEIVSGALAETATTLGLSQIFMGVVALALIGTISDLFAAVWFARDDKMGLAISICLGSAIQIALVMAPVLVIASWLFGRPMSLVFNNPLDLFAIAATAYVVNAIAGDGETTWFEGVLLVGVYMLLAAAFFFV